MKQICLFLLVCLCFITSKTSAQSLAINTDGSTANASALLDVKSTAKGILVPRMSRTERNAIAAPVTGLLIFQNGPDSIGFHYFDGTRWTWLLSNSNSDSLAWRTNGNTGTNPVNHFLGTNDNVPLVLKTNNSEKLRVTTAGELGIGTITPNSTYGYAKVEIASEGYLAPTDLLIRNAANNAGYAPGLVFQHARGTLAAPVTVNNGDYLSAIGTMNYDGSNYILSAGLDIYADGAIAAGIVPTRLQLNTMNTLGSYATRVTIKNNGRIGIGTTNPLARTHTSGGNFLADGVFGTDSTIAFSGTGTRIFFYPRKAALRAGNVSGTQWDDANIGNFSVGVGQNAQAKTDHSVSIGAGNIAETSPFAVAIGRENHSTGFASLAMGHFSEAAGDYSVAIGLRDTIYVGGFGATAFGGYNKISQQYGFAAGFSNTIGTSGLNAFVAGSTNTVNANSASAMGFSNVANGFASFTTGIGNYTGNAYAVAMGELDSSKANNSFTMGSSNTVNGNFGAAIGVFNYAPSYAEMTVGHFATTYTALSNSGVNVADRVFTIGNGTGAGSRSNAMVVLKNGNIGAGTALPNSTLHVDGTIAIGTSLNIAGGTVGTPVSLLNQKSYVGVLPANATNNYYQLPDPTAYPGRTYIIRNNSSVDQANITTAAGLLFPGNSNVGGATYTLNPTSFPKTVMAISDGANWTIMVQN